MLPKVSIGVRSYNQKQYLKEALDSVLAQDYEPMEIVVADDASTDGTQEMLREYDEKYPGLFKIILNKKNLGHTANSNVVFFACTGKYIAWLDGDDLFLPGKIKKQVALMESRPDCAICHHDTDVFDTKTGKVLHNFDGQPKGEIPEEGGIEILFQKYFFHNCATMTRRDACPQKGYNTGLVEHSDPLFWFETALNGNICYIPELLARYRRHENNVTKPFSDDQWRVKRFMTFGVLHAKYPDLARNCRAASGKAEHFYRAAVQMVLDGKGKDARNLLMESLRQGWVSWKWIAWYFKSHFLICLIF